MVASDMHSAAVELLKVSLDAAGASLAGGLAWLLVFGLVIPLLARR